MLFFNIILENYYLEKYESLYSVIYIMWIYGRNSFIYNLILTNYNSKDGLLYIIYTRHKNCIIYYLQQRGLLEYFLQLNMKN